MDTLGTLNQLGTLGEEQDPTGALNAATYANQMAAPRLPTENAALIAQQYLHDRSIYDQMLQQKMAAGARAESLARQKQAEWEAAAPLREQARKLSEVMMKDKEAAAQGQQMYYIVNAMSDVLGMPEEQQAAAFEQRKRHLISVGVDPEVFEDAYNPESFKQGLKAMAPIAQTWAELNGKMGKAQKGKPVPYLDDMGQPQFLPEGQMPPKGWVPYDKPTKPEKGTQLAQLIEEQRQYPKGSPEWKAYQQRISKEMTHQPATTVNVSAEKKFGEKVAEREAEHLYKEKDDAVDAAGNMVTINNAVKLLDSGIYSGRFANLKLEFGKALHAAGIGYADDAVANTEAYVANQASMVGSIIKLFGAGTGLSDADREYAEKAAAGKITLNEASMRKILGMASKVSKYRLDKYNKKARKLQDKFKDSIPYSLEVEMPEGASSASDVKSMSDEDLLRELGK